MITRDRIRKKFLKRKLRSKKNKGTKERPRLVVFRSNRYIYVQAVDDTQGHTIAAASSFEKEIRESLKATCNIKAAEKVGELIAKRLLEKNITKAVFDRNGYIYHGKVKALADAARKAGLNF